MRRRCEIGDRSRGPLEERRARNIGGKAFGPREALVAVYIVVKTGADVGKGCDTHHGNGQWANGRGSQLQPRVENYLS